MDVGGSERLAGVSDDWRTAGFRFQRCEGVVLHRLRRSGMELFEPPRRVEVARNQLRRLGHAEAKPAGATAPRDVHGLAEPRDPTLRSRDDVPTCVGRPAGIADPRPPSYGPTPGYWSVRGSSSRHRVSRLGGTGPMRASRFTNAQKAFILRRGAEGMPVADICRQAGISQAAYSSWKKRHEGLTPPERHRLKQLEDENTKLRKLVADLSLDRERLKDVIRRTS
jgi:putative transposase